MEDLGSGTFVDFTKYGLLKEPTVQESVAAGADIVTFSGDKLLGGPQAGIIVGKNELLEEIKNNPITRALRIDKLTLSALEHTLRLYRKTESAMAQIPTLRMLTLPFDHLATKANELANLLESIGDPRLATQTLDLSSKAGGGALPRLDLPSRGIGVKINGASANAIEKHMRTNEPPIMGRIEEDIFIMDLRTIQDDEYQIIKKAFANMLTRI